MTRLTDTLDFDEQLPLSQQPGPVQQFLHQLLETPPTSCLTESCGGELTRPLCEEWRVGSAQVLRHAEYQHPATAAACLAKKNITLVLRPYYPPHVD